MTSLSAGGALLREVRVATESGEGERKRFLLGELAAILRLRAGVSILETDAGSANVVFRVRGGAGEADAYQVKAEGGRLVFEAGGERGLLFALYAWARARLGVECATPLDDALRVAPMGSVDLLDGGVSAAPAFAMRQLGFPPDYPEVPVARLIHWMGWHGWNSLYLTSANLERLYGQAAPELRRRGMELFASVRSMNAWLPLEVFDGRPEYFSEIGGRRVRSTQVKRCGANPAAVELFVANAVEWIKAHPDVDVVHAIANDGAGWCECPACRRLSPMRQWDRFVRPLMEAVRALPSPPRMSFRCFTQLYEPIRQYEPDENWLFDCQQRCFWHALDDESCGRMMPQQELVFRGKEIPPGRSRRANRFYLDALKDFRARVTGRLWVYENVTRQAFNFTVYPCYGPIVSDMRLYRSLGVDGISLQVSPGSWRVYAPNIHFYERLAWGADMGRDALLGEWVATLDEADADGVLRCLDLLEGASGAMESPCYWQDLREAVLNDAERAARGSGCASIRAGVEHLRLRWECHQTGLRALASFGAGDLSQAAADTGAYLDAVLRLWGFLTERRGQGVASSWNALFNMSKYLLFKALRGPGLALVDQARTRADSPLRSVLDRSIPVFQEQCLLKEKRGLAPDQIDREWEVEMGALRLLIERMRGRVWLVETP